MVRVHVLLGGDFFKFQFSCLFLGEVLIKQLFHSRFEMTIPNEARCAELAIYLSYPTRTGGIIVQ